MTKSELIAMLSALGGNDIVMVQRSEDGAMFTPVFVMQENHEDDQSATIWIQVVDF